MGKGSVMLATNKAKRSRKSAPKVRTGCSTCKTRHLKCGEERPICLRCRNDGFTCDGYPAASPSATSNVTTISQPRSKKKKALAPQIPWQINYDISGSAVEKLYFHHVRECTIGHLGFSSTHTDFWKQLVLPTAHTDVSVKHALVALGMAHRTFIECPGVDSLHELMLQQYNAAIRHLTDASKGNNVDARQTLICCLIFYCLETILGHYGQSLQHLRAGSRLLYTHLQQNRSPNGDKPTGISADTIRQIADVFAVLGVDAGFFIDENLTPGLVYTTSPDMDDEILGRPFADLVDARKHVNAIVVDFNHTVEFHRHDWYAPEMCVLYERFKRWARRFDRTNFKFANGNGKPTQAERHELLSMRIARKLWMAVIDQDDKEIPMSNPSYNAQFSQILDEAEELVNQLSEVRHPVFSLQADTVPPLAYICDLNSDPGIQRRAITLLRSLKRREGIWDSQEVADYLEDYVLAKQMYQMNWDDLPGGVPGQVRVISDLNMSSLGPRNGILRLAAEGLQDSFGFGPMDDNILIDYVKSTGTGGKGGSFDTRLEGYLKRKWDMPTGWTVADTTSSSSSPESCLEVKKSLFETWSILSRRERYSCTDPIYHLTKDVRFSSDGSSTDDLETILDRSPPNVQTGYLQRLLRREM